MRYLTGQELKAGDQVRFHGETGIVEFVVDSRSGDPALDWYMDEFGGGAMLSVPSMGSVFLSPAHEPDEDLEFVSRRS